MSLPVLFREPRLTHLQAMKPLWQPRGWDPIIRPGLKRTGLNNYFRHGVRGGVWHRVSFSFRNLWQGVGWCAFQGVTNQCQIIVLYVLYRTRISKMVTFESKQLHTITIVFFVLNLLAIILSIIRLLPFVRKSGTFHEEDRSPTTDLLP